MDAWTRDELILALDLYRRKGTLRPIHEDVIKLSMEIDRTPGSVSLRLGNFLALDPAAPEKGLTNWSEDCRKIWEEFEDDPARLRTAASAIRHRHSSVSSEGVIKMQPHEKINRWLASSISKINAVVATTLPPVLGLFGGGLTDSPLGLLAGILIGALIVMLVCGSLSLLIDIRNSLVQHDRTSDSTDA